MGKLPSQISLYIPRDIHHTMSPPLTVLLLWKVPLRSRCRPSSFPQPELSQSDSLPETESSSWETDACLWGGRSGLSLTLLGPGISLPFSIFFLVQALLDCYKLLTVFMSFYKVDSDWFHSIFRLFCGGSDTWSSLPCHFHWWHIVCFCTIKVYYQLPM